MTTDDFQVLIHQKGRELYRPMPWRDQPTLYYVLVSELMLQQTQVSRVLPKFDEFTRRFPTIEQLATAELDEVLAAWQGLGYNRRAKYLHDAARQVVANGVPKIQQELVKLPGVGVNTAAAILNYVYEIPTPFIETNIRSVYFHHFFADREKVSDRDVLVKVAETLDYDQPRQWFWALMDYGTELKRQGYGRLAQSKQYTKQSPLAGSLREMRGEIIRRHTNGQLIEHMCAELATDPRFMKALDGLKKDGLL